MNATRYIPIGRSPEDGLRFSSSMVFNEMKKVNMESLDLPS